MVLLIGFSFSMNHLPVMLEKSYLLVALADHIVSVETMCLPLSSMMGEIDTWLYTNWL